MPSGAACICCAFKSALSLHLHFCFVRCQSKAHGTCHDGPRDVVLSSCLFVLAFIAFCCMVVAVCIPFGPVCELSSSDHFSSLLWRNSVCCGVLFASPNYTRPNGSDRLFVAQEEELKDAILLVFANKQDQQGSLNPQEVRCRVHGRLAA